MDDKNTSSPDMLVFPYQINKIIRDMKFVSLPNEEAEARRDAIVGNLQEICRRIEEDFK